MGWWHCKLTRKDHLWGYADCALQTTIDVIWLIVFFSSLILSLIEKEFLTVVLICVGILGVGIIVGSICAVICRNFEYKEEKLKLDLECYKYERDMMRREEKNNV